MKCGLLLAIRKTSNGFGWRSIRKHKKSSVFMLVNVAAREHRDYGSLYPPFIDNVQYSTPIFGLLTVEIFPESRHRPVGEKSGKTNLIERFNCTLRQRVSRLVRKTLSFSKKLENHIGAIWYFIHHHNELLRI